MIFLLNFKRHIKDIDEQWNALKTAAETKRKCLDDAHKCVLFIRLCDDLISSFEETEAQLSTDDNGQDLSSCKMFLLRHETLTRQVDSQQEKINEIEVYLNSNRDNFMLKKMRDNATLVKQRYEDLQEPMLIRNENLEEALSYFTVIHDMKDSRQWIQDKYPLVSTDELGSNLEETKKLLKKHQQLEQELQTHAILLQNVLKTIKQLVERKHFAHSALNTKMIELEQEWTSFRVAFTARDTMLQDALEVQQFYADADELMLWLKEKQPEITSTDYGKDDAGSLSHLKKLQALVNDIRTNQKHKCASLAQSAIQLQARDHYDKKNVARKQLELEQLLSNLVELGAEREEHLNAMLKVFEFERECESTANWIKDQNVVAASQEFGSDLEHAETLLKKFSEFISDLSKNSDRIRKIDEMAQCLCENKYTPNSHIDSIDDKCSTLNDMWRELNTLTDVRKQTLEGAIEVHTFDKDCDDLITWATEKERFLLQEDIGYFNLF
jgi:spectrin beta